MPLFWQDVCVGGLNYLYAIYVFISTVKFCAEVDRVLTRQGFVGYAIGFRSSTKPKQKRIQLQFLAIQLQIGNK